MAKVIMFHQFFNNNFYNCKGAVNEDQFYNFCKKLSSNYEIIDPNDFDQISKNEGILLTFDDGLKSQYEIAFNILKSFNIKSIFFVFTSILTSNPNLLEVFKYFSHVYFKSIDEFYNYYFSIIFKNKNDLKNILNKFDSKIKLMKVNSPFYSLNDIIYRILRFEILTKSEFDQTHLHMINKVCGENIENLKNKLHINDKDINILIKYGNKIGNHSHSHAYDLHKKSFHEQYIDYKKNNDYLNKISNNQIDYCAFPFGLYNEETIKVVNKLNFKYCFSASHKNTSINKKIINRYDHSLFINNNNIDLRLLDE